MIRLVCLSEMLEGRYWKGKKKSNYVEVGRVIGYMPRVGLFFSREIGKCAKDMRPLSVPSCREKEKM
jgi:hypothetical protein